jgi:integrase
MSAPATFDRAFLRHLEIGPCRLDEHGEMDLATPSLHLASPGCRAKPSKAEGVGFEPTVPKRVQRFSRPSDSATLASLQQDLRCLALTVHDHEGRQVPSGRAGLPGSLTDHFQLIGGRARIREVRFHDLRPAHIAYLIRRWRRCEAVATRSGQRGSPTMTPTGVPSTVCSRRGTSKLIGLHPSTRQHDVEAVG